MTPTSLIRLASSNSIRQVVAQSTHHSQPRAPTQIQTRPRRAAFSLPPAVLMYTRRGFGSAGQLQARVGSQDRESIDTEATEYSKSGTDDSAAHTDEAFDPSTTDPKGEKEGSKKDLEVSPANPEVSKPPKNDGGAESSGKD